MDAIAMLGCKATDRVLGIKGVVTSISFDLVGCVQGFLQPEAQKDQRVPEGRWIDVVRLDAGKRVVPLMFAGEVTATHDKGASEKSAPSCR